MEWYAHARGHKDMEWYAHARGHKDMEWYAHGGWFGRWHREVERPPGATPHVSYSQGVGGEAEAALPLADLDLEAPSSEHQLQMQ